MRIKTAIANNARLRLAALLVGMASTVTVFFPATASAFDDEESGWLSCHKDGCSGSAECKGEFFLDNGKCSITCYERVNNGQQVEKNGTVGCGSGSEEL